MKKINDVEVGTYVTNGYDCDSGIAIVKVDEQGKKFYAYQEMTDEISEGEIINVSDFDDDHLA